MKSFEYADEEIGGNEVGFVIPSVVIGAGVLSFPRTLSEVTKNADGWVSILLGGMLAIIFTWVATTLAARFPKQTFFDYSSLLVSKPIAFIMTGFIGLYFTTFAAYEIRFVATVSQQYLFASTPKEVLSLVFLVVVIYAVAGSRAALFRLHQLFLPIIIGILIIVLLMTIPLMDVNHLFPLFQTDWMGYMKGVKTTFQSFLGWAVLLFYTSLMNQPNHSSKAGMIGMSIPIILYVLIYLAAIGVLSNVVTANLTYPTNELAKVVEVPGGFFERMEIVFFTIWVMALFTTAIVYLDITVMALSSLFKNTKKITFIFILAPMIYLISMLPQGRLHVNQLGEILGYVGISISMLIPTVLLIVAKLRRLKGDG
ncbi:endospore germination permease [Halobacillus shinanisalinarum]|uniref:Endospore germination permease n=1 Tax=Halobacillus shinanisalinarum TaxID=2932258 RepID=A0ABY4H2S8_9BACI|nr:endospore germination permease [Halobacillus shinanisalinarum]UOQ94767.1 endospore germination permease [Halobacillus shinanisalinarum]